MFDFLYGLSDMSVFVLMAFATIAFSLLFVVLNKFFKFYKLKYIDNTTTASVASLIGIVYGVLAGFLCLYLLNNQDHASNAALDEGTAAANIYHESRWLNNPYQKQIQAYLKTYLSVAINKEWPEMAKGNLPHRDNAYLIAEMSDSLISYPITTLRDALVINNIKQDIRSLLKGREERIEMGGSQLTSGIWNVIILSTALIIIINYAFRVNFKLHIFGLTSFALMAASVLFLLVTLDRPFEGEFAVAPDALNTVLDSMTHDGA